jgi:hypothetical protein
VAKSGAVLQREFDAEVERVRGAHPDLSAEQIFERALSTPVGKAWYAAAETERMAASMAVSIE